MPKVKSTEVSKSTKEGSQTAPKQEKPKHKDNSSNLMKKALDDTRKSSQNEPKKASKGGDASSYVKTNKDGRKIINLTKSANARVEEEERTNSKPQRQHREEFKKAESGTTSSVFDRLKPKSKDTEKNESRQEGTKTSHTFNMFKLISFFHCDLNNFYQF